MVISPGHSTIDERLVELDRLAVRRPELAARCRRAGAVIGFITFIASTISNVSPALTVSPGADERLRARLAGEIDGADHRRLDRAWMVGRSRLRRRGEPAAAGGGQRGAAAGAAIAGAGTDGDLALRRGSVASPSSTSISVRSFWLEELGELADQLGLDAACRPLRTRRVRRSFLFPFKRRALVRAGGRVQREQITKRAEAGDRSLGRRPDKAPVAEGLARRADWTDEPRSPAREIAFIASCSATDVWVKPPGLRITAFAPSALASCSQSIRWPSWLDWRMSSSQAEALGPILQPPGNVVERVGAVDFRLAQPEQVEVGAVEDIDGGWRRHGGTL